MISTKKATTTAALVLALGATGFGVTACSSSSSSAKASCADMSQQIQNGLAANSANAADPAKSLAAIQALAKAVSDSAAKATDPAAKTALTNFATDYTTLANDLQKMQGGDTSGLSDMQTTMSKLQPDLTAVQAVCK